ncbi:MAG TPA: SufE family protein [Opitutaceae bacterium]|nr:SufE family protein [Opitutaceae bacterium]
MSLSARQHTLIEDLLLIEDPQERLTAVIDFARKSPPFPEALRTEENRVTGCQSQVWLHSIPTSGSEFVVAGDSDSPLVRGLVVWTCNFFSQESPQSVSSSLPASDPLALVGLTKSLSASRQNGLASVRARIAALARDYSE